MLVLIWVQTVYKGYQQTTKVTDKGQKSKIIFKFVSVAF